MDAKRVLIAIAVGASSVTACSVLPVTGDPLSPSVTRVRTLDPQDRTPIERKAPLAIQWDRTRDRDLLVEINPRTLKSGRRVLIGPQGGHAYDMSPDGERLLVANRAGSFRLIDLSAMRQERSFESGSGWPLVVNWLTADRSVVVRANRTSTNATVIDPTSGEVLSRQTLEGSAVRWRRAGGRVVVVTQEYRGYTESHAPARLGVVDATGEIRTVTLDRIAAGFSMPLGDPFGRSLTPALAVRGNEAIVIGTEGSIARVDLTSMALDYPAPRRSLFRALSGALLPFAHAKFSEGLSLWARWIDRDVLALTGTRMDVSGTEHAPTFESNVAPIRLLDTRTWQVTRWEGTGNRLAVSDGMVLTYDGSRTERQPLGVTAWSPDGNVLWRAMPNKHISRLTVRGRLAFVRHGYKRVLRSVIDVRNGRVLVTRPSFAAVLPY